MGELRQRDGEHKRTAGVRRNQTGQRRYTREARINNRKDGKQAEVRSYREEGENIEEAERN